MGLGKSALMLLLHGFTAMAQLSLGTDAFLNHFRFNQMTYLGCDAGQRSRFLAEADKLIACSSQRKP